VHVLFSPDERMTEVRRLCYKSRGLCYNEKPREMASIAKLVDAEEEPILDRAKEEARMKFLDSLTAFMAERGTPFDKVPIFDHKELDLFSLYQSVIARGGLEVVLHSNSTRTAFAQRETRNNSFFSQGYREQAVASNHKRARR
jgi:hypothetical protein